LIESKTNSGQKNGRIPVQSIKTIMFDLDGTLRHNDPPGVDIFHDMVEAEGWPLDESARRAAERWTYQYWASSDDLKSDLAEVGDEREELYRLFAQRHLELLGIAPEARRELSQRLYRRMMAEYSPVDLVPEDVRPTLEWIRTQGFGVGLVSNRHEPLQSVVEELSLEGLFDFTLAAGEVGWWKPDPRLLRHAAELAEARPGAAVYVGDNPYADVKGAAKAGIHPILIDPRGLFPEANCPSIETIGQLPSLLNGN
jgi:HAD superfamily hydrolase (TIGR01549 family)